MNNRGDDHTIQSLPLLTAPLKGPMSRTHQRFDDLIHHHWTRLHQAAIRMCGNEDDADDLLSMTLIDAFRSFPVYRGSGFERWLSAILRSNRIDMLRRRQFLSLDAFAPDGTVMAAGSDALHDERMDPARFVLQQIYSEELEFALKQLPESFRIAVLLRDVEQYEYQEIAAMLGISVGTVRSRIHRGRLHLRDSLRNREK